MHLHEFLSEIHLIVEPTVYLEIGVQHGYSLNRAHRAVAAIGIDPEPLTTAVGNQSILKMKSDTYFEIANGAEKPCVDFGFVDGLHHYEQALRDFLNMEKMMTAKGVIVMDDVLPRNQQEAAREMRPGDWTGDVWKASNILIRCRGDLTLFEVDTQPTGTLIAFGFGYNRITSQHGQLVDEGELDRMAAHYAQFDTVPDYVLQRTHAIHPSEALERLKEFLDGTQQLDTNLPVRRGELRRGETRPVLDSPSEFL